MEYRVLAGVRDEHVCPGLLRSRRVIGDRGLGGGGGEERAREGGDEKRAREVGDFVKTIAGTAACPKLLDSFYCDMLLCCSNEPYGESGMAT